MSSSVRTTLPQKQETDDGVLITRVSDGDMSALGALYDRYEDAVRRLVSRLGVSPSDVDDLVQQTFMGVLHSAKSFDHRTTVRAWLMGVAAFTVRRHRRSITTVLRRIVRFASEPKPSQPTPERLGELNEAALRAQRALEKLSEKKREVFLLVAVEGLPGEEVARSLDIPVATVWTRLHHARRELREMLEEESP
ncbi:MAG: RNA polymerase sigma factor [Polyangiaceae bacterium]